MNERENASLGKRKTSHTYIISHLSNILYYYKYSSHEKWNSFSNRKYSTYVFVLFLWQVTKYDIIIRELWMFTSFIIEIYFCICFSHIRRFRESGLTNKWGATLVTLTKNNDRADSKLNKEGDHDDDDESDSDSPSTQRKQRVLTLADLQVIKII